MPKRGVDNMHTFLYVTDTGERYFINAEKVTYMLNCVEGYVKIGFDDGQYITVPGTVSIIWNQYFARYPNCNCVVCPAPEDE